MFGSEDFELFVISLSSTFFLPIWLFKFKKYAGERLNSCKTACVQLNLFNLECCFCVVGGGCDLPPCLTFDRNYPASVCVIL